MGSAFAQSMEMLDVTGNMDSFHQPPMNMNLNMQPRQIPRQPHHQQQNNDPCEPVYANLSIASPDNNSENINFFAHLPIDTGCKLNVHKTFRTSSERLMYVQHTSCVHGVIAVRRVHAAPIIRSEYTLVWFEKYVGSDNESTQFLTHDTRFSVL